MCPRNRQFSTHLTKVTYHFASSLYDQLQEIVQLAAQPLPERPDGIICVVKFTSSLREDCRMTEAEYERMARENPATIFLRCFAEYDNADLLLAQAAVTTWPSYDVFSGGEWH